MTKAEAKQAAIRYATEKGMVYVVVKNPYIGGWWVVTQATATMNGLKPVFETAQQ